MIFSVRFFLLFTLISGVIGCQTMDNLVKGFQDLVGISTTVVMYNPPNHPTAARIKRIAVVGDESEMRIRDKTEAMFAKIQINGGPYFKLIEKKDSERIRKLHVTELTGHEFNKESVAEYGRWLGTEGIYVITNVKQSNSDSKFIEERSECILKVKKKCKKYKKYNVDCTQRSVLFSFTPKLVDVESMQIVYGHEISTPQEDKICTDSKRPIRTNEELLETAKTNALVVLRQDVTPYTTTEKILIKTGDVKNSKAENLLEIGENFAAKGRWERACKNWQQAAELAPQSPSPWYNLGICGERIGKFQEAVNLYTKADNLTKEPDQRISDRLLSAQEKLKRSKVHNHVASKAN